MENNNKTPRTLKRYTVVITPKYQVFSGSNRGGEHTIDVPAYDQNGALKKARNYWRFEGDGGPNGIPATYRAKIAE